MAATTSVLPPRTMMAVFNSLPEGTRVQLIENNIVMSPVPLDRHQVMIDEIYPDLSIYVKKNKLGATRTAPYDVFLDRKNAFQPDICFIGNAKLNLIKKDGLHGVPDLVIEILSPGTARYDLVAKKEVYERCGVAELWFVDPADKAVTGYFIENDQYHLLLTGTGIIASRLIGFNLEF